MIYTKTDTPFMTCPACGALVAELVEGECWCCWDDKHKEED